MILERMGIECCVRAPRIEDETRYLDQGDLNRSLQRLAEAKARSVEEVPTDALVLGADTVVLCEDTLLGKPVDSQEAARMLRMLSGRGHEVITAVALWCATHDYCVSTVDFTKVYFRIIEEEDILAYIKRADYKDKAGAYAIQDEGAVLVRAIDGCFYNVVGLPVASTINLFNKYRKDCGNG